MKLIIFALILALILPGCVQEQSQKQEINVGAIESLSGNAAYYGEQNRKGVEIAREETQAKFPNFKIEVLHEDSQYTAQGGVAAYRKIKEL